MDVEVGVVCNAGQTIRTGRSDNYVVGSRGRVSWLEDGQERSVRMGGVGVLLAAVDGESAGDASTPSTAVARILAKLYDLDLPRDPLQVLTEWLADAHTRMHWKTHADGETTMGAAVAVAWVVDNVLHWVEVGTARVVVFREGVMHSLAKPWPMARTQRLISGSHGLGDDAAVHLRRGVNCGSVRLRGGDQVVLATDGFWNTVDDASAADLLRHITGVQASAVSCMERAVARGSRDDVTVLIAELSSVVEEPVQRRPVVRAGPPARRRRRGRHKAPTVP